MTSKTLEGKTINIKGKKYAQVKDRVLWLDENKSGAYSIETNYEYFADRRMWVVKATLTVDGMTYTGLAQEVEVDDYTKVNSTSALENCETSAIGRACAAFGLGIQDSYASSNEVYKAQGRQLAAAKVAVPTTYIDPLGEAKEQLKVALEEAGHDNAVKMKVVINKVLNKSTVDTVKEAYEVIQAISEGLV